MLMATPPPPSPRLDDLWRHLEDLGVLNNPKKPHPVFGIVSEKLKEMENRK